MKPQTLYPKPCTIEPNRASAGVSRKDVLLRSAVTDWPTSRERMFFMGNRIHFIIQMIWLSGLTLMETSGQIGPQ
jgi:hypothetical protein